MCLLVICFKGNTPAELVPSARKRLKLLTIDHIDYVEKQLGERGTEVTNGEKYLMACLYNAPVDCMVHAARDRNA